MRVMYWTNFSCSSCLIRPRSSSNCRLIRLNSSFDCRLSFSRSSSNCRTFFSSSSSNFRLILSRSSFNCRLIFSCSSFNCRLIFSCSSFNCRFALAMKSALETASLRACSDRIARSVSIWRCIISRSDSNLPFNSGSYLWIRSMASSNVRFCLFTSFIFSL